MSMFDPPPPLSDLLLSILAAAVGRVTLLASAPRGPITLRRALWFLAWEVPLTCAVGMIGYWLTSWADLTGGAAAITIALLGRKGVDVLEPLVDALLPQLRRSKP